jgi:hypothetical protein
MVPSVETHAEQGYSANPSSVHADLEFDNRALDGQILQPSHIETVVTPTGTQPRKREEFYEHDRARRHVGSASVM